ncbi:MAG TPA: hypothetical protein VF115_14820 [Acidimicrobiia bacterium]
MQKTALSFGQAVDRVNVLAAMGLARRNRAGFSRQTVCLQKIRGTSQRKEPKMIDSKGRGLDENSTEDVVTHRRGWLVTIVLLGVIGIALWYMMNGSDDV